jgi:hypothetical protein
MLAAVLSMPMRLFRTLGPVLLGFYGGLLFAAILVKRAG